MPTIEEILREQQAFVGRVQSRIEEAGADREIDPAALVEDKDAELSALRRQREEALLARQATAAKWDRMISQHDATIARLERELSAAKEVLRRIREEERRPRPVLGDIAGIGPARIEGLRGIGITSVAELAEANSERVSQGLGVSLEAANGFIAAARELQGRR